MVKPKARKANTAKTPHVKKLVHPPKPSGSYSWLWVAFIIVAAVLLSAYILSTSSSPARNPNAFTSSPIHSTASISSPSYPIDSQVLTTTERTILPVAVPSTSPKLKASEVSHFSQYGYGIWKYGPGTGYDKRLDLMSATYTGASATPAANLLNFFTMTDIHLTDKESPAQAVYYGYGWGVISGYSPAMLYNTQVFDAAVQTANALNQKTPFNFGLFLGDGINSGQYNELRWYIDILDGQTINPDSGVKDDPIPGPLNDYQDSYKAAGLDPSIPWYQVLGNHDHYWMGMYPPDAYIRNALIGNQSLNMGNVLSNPINIRSRGFYMGAIDGRTINGEVMGAGPVANFSSPPTMPADPNRRFVSRNEWLAQFSNTTSNPIGHGFNATDAASGFACYSFEPNSSLPIKVIVLDDTQRDDDPAGGAFGRGALDSQRYDWLVKELDAGQAEGKLMIIAAHIPIGIGEVDSPLGWTSISYASDAKLIAKLHEYPNLILWVSGHRHLNTITALKSPDAARPELGFWEVETSSLREFPQQFRTFDIVRNSDNTLSIFTADVDPAVREGSPAALSRTYALAAHQAFGMELMGPYNAELVKQLTPEMQAKIQNYGTPMQK